MKAIRLHQRGGPEQIVYEDAPVPEPKPGEARLRVHVAGLTPTELTWDETYKSADGSPRLPTIPGHDVCGTIDALGSGTTDFEIGDVVYGLVDFPRDGCAAEYVTIPVTDIAPKPKSLDEIQSAAVPLSALTAVQALIEHGKLQKGEAVLIHGAAGGVGAYAVQVAKNIGAKVIATASSRHAAFLEELGVDTLIDYTTTRFETVAGDVSVVLDTMGGETRERSWQILKPGGILIGLNAPIAPGHGGRADVRGLFFIVRPNRNQLTEIARWIDNGKLRPFVEAVYPLVDGRKAFEHALSGHLRGKIVLRVAERCAVKNLPAGSGVRQRPGLPMPTNNVFFWFWPIASTPR